MSDLQNASIIEFENVTSTWASNEAKALSLQGGFHEVVYVLNARVGIDQTILPSWKPVSFAYRTKQWEHFVGCRRVSLGEFVDNAIAFERIHDFLQKKTRAPGMRPAGDFDFVTLQIQISSGSRDLNDREGSP